MTSAFSGGRALVETLISHGVDTAFCLPGESYLGVIDSLREHQNEIRLVVTRHESGASFAACAHARMTNKPGIAFVSRGPGASNAAIGVHTARQDSTPLVLFIGQVPTDQLGREAFQEVDYHIMYGPLAKGVMQTFLPSEVADITQQALALAVDGRPGPVVVVLPENVTTNESRNEEIPAPTPRPVYAAEADAIARAAQMINESRHPIVIGGEMINFEAANDALENFLSVSGAGLCAAFRRQGVIPTDHPACLGHFGLALAPYQKEMWEEVDLVIAAGSRLDAATTMDFELVRRDQLLIHIFPDNAVLRVNAPDVSLKSDCGAALDALSKALTAPPPEARLAWRRAQREKYEAWATPPNGTALGAVDMNQVMSILGEKLPADCTVTNDAGNFATWLHRYLPFRHRQAQAGPAAGAMGFAVPGALGVQLARPGKTVVALVGDGGFLMTGQELVTAVEQDLPIKVIVCDNSAYATIAMHQVRRFGVANQYGVNLQSPDFAAVARAWGVAAWGVTRTEQFAPALDAALAHGGPALIHLKTDLRDLAASGLKLES
ncbi:MAG: thiamine pyrophosphate-dependent enzyme [Alphaproteobacteria bacterium]